MRSGRRLTAAVAFAACFAAAGSRADVRPALFSSYTVLDLRLEAPLHKLFAETDEAKGAKVEGTITYTDPATGRAVTIDGVEISLRGNSSLDDGECTFPKLKLHFRRGAPIDETVFRGDETVKIGTHCADRPDGDLTELGRLANQLEPHREALAYRLLEALGVPTLKARPARITYVFTDPARTSTNDPPSNLTRDAFLAEDTPEAIARLGGVGELEDFRDATADFPPDDAARIAFGEAAIGNFDWCLKFSSTDRYRCDARHPLWNLTAAKRADGTAFPLMYDFDLSGIVTADHQWFGKVFNAAFRPHAPRAVIEVIAQVQRTRNLFARDELDRMRQAFLARRTAAYAALAAAAVDDEGRALAKQYLDAFFDAIGSDPAFYLPVVVRDGARPYLDPAGNRPVCGADTIPTGTPVGAIADRRGAMIQAPLLDTSWLWDKRCPAIRQGAVWLDSTAVSRDYPR